MDQIIQSCTFHFAQKPQSEICTVCFEFDKNVTKSRVEVLNVVSPSKFSLRSIDVKKEFTEVEKSLIIEGNRKFSLFRKHNKKQFGRINSKELLDHWLLEEKKLQNIKIHGKCQIVYLIQVDRKAKCGRKSTRSSGADLCWYRAVMLSSLSHNSNKGEVVLYCLDYGYEFLSDDIINIFKASSEASSHPCFSVKAQIIDLLPLQWNNYNDSEVVRTEIELSKQGISWSIKAQDEFKKLVRGCNDAEESRKEFQVQFTIEIFNIYSGNIFSVELVRALPDNVWTKVYEPIGHILVGKHLAKWSNTSINPLAEKITMTTEELRQKEYVGIIERLNKGSKFVIGTLTILAPTNIQLQVVSYKDNLSEKYIHVQSELDSMLSSKGTEILKNPNYKIYLPFSNLPCLYYGYDIDKNERKWIRVKILQTFCKSEDQVSNFVKLKDVDTGQILSNCSPTDLRLLPLSLASIFSLTVSCSLHKLISPTYFSDWNRIFVQALDRLLTKCEEIYPKESLQAYVECKQDDIILEVTLYQKYDDETLRCINGALIRRGYAVRADARHCAISNQEYYRRTKMTTLPGENDITSNAAAENLAQSCITFSNCYPFQATVLKAISPDHIYIRTSEQVFYLQVFTRRLTDFYAQNKPKAKREWYIGDRCVAILSKKRNIHSVQIVVGAVDCAVRGSVLRVLDKTITIKLTDYGNKEIVMERENIMPINKTFSSIKSGIFYTVVSISLNLIPASSYHNNAKFPRWSLNEIDRLNCILPMGTSVCVVLMEKFCEYCKTSQDDRFPSRERNMFANLYLLEPQNNSSSGELDSTNVALQFIDKGMAYLYNLNGSTDKDSNRSQSPCEKLTSPRNQTEITEEKKSCTCERNNYDDIVGGIQFSVPIMQEDIPKCFDFRRGNIWEPFPLKDVLTSDVCNESLYRFRAILKAITSDGSLYVMPHKFKAIDEALKVELQTLYENYSAHPHDLFWFKGQPCIAYLKSERLWYRGIIEEVYKDRYCEVWFIDLGMSDCVSYMNLRKDISPNVYKKPVLCIGCEVDILQLPDYKGTERETLLELTGKTLSSCKDGFWIQAPNIELMNGKLSNCRIITKGVSLETIFQKKKRWSLHEN